MLRRLQLALILLALIFIVGIAGYVLIEGWSFFDALYMTVITIATVGYGEVKPLSPYGRTFTIFLIILGMGILLFCISTFTAFLVEGELSEILRRRKMEKHIAKLKSHYIVAGIGRIGRHIIDELLKTGRPFVAIDNREDVCTGLSDKGIAYIKGDATSTAVLKAANAEHAKGIFCSLQTDADNLLLIITAKGINPNLKVIAKADEDESEEKMIKAGADGVVLHKFIGGMRMLSEMVRPETVTFLDKMLKSHEEIFRFEDIIINSDSPWNGKTIKNLRLSDIDGVTIVAVKKGDKYIFNPSEDEELKSGDALIFIGETKNVREIKKLAGH
jgi:voltage-gated potassium channel